MASVHGVYLDPVTGKGRLVPLAVDSDGKLLIGATIEAQISDIEISNDTGNPVPATLAAGTNYIGHVGVTMAEIGVELTRPADTPGAYSVYDVISDSTSAPTVMEFQNCALANGRGGYISKVRAFTNSATALLGTQIRMHVYNVAPTAVNDHAQFPLLYTNRSGRVGYIDLDPFTTEGTGSDSAYTLWSQMPLKFHTAPDSTSLFVVPEVRVAGAAPASGQKIHIFLGLEQH